MPTPRKPSKLKLLEGNRGRRPISSEPEPMPGAPPMPPGMPSAAQTLWKHLVPELEALGLLTLVDGGALEGACRAIAQGRAADKAIEKLQKRIGSGRSEEHDFYRLSILNAVSRKAWGQYRAFCIEFGLTPASRTRLAVEDLNSRAARPVKVDYIERCLTADWQQTIPSENVHSHS